MASWFENERSVNVMSSLIEKRTAVVTLYNAGNSVSDIVKQLRGGGVTRLFVYRTLKRYKDTGDVVDRVRTGRPRVVRTKETIKAVRERIRRNPARKQKIMAREMKISTRSMSRILRDDLKMKAYKRYTGHLLTPQLKEIRRVRSKALLARHGKNGHRDILFTDEKIFTIEQKFNRQNDRVYARSSYEAKDKIPRVQRGHHPSSVMAWWGVSYNGVTDVQFCEQGVKTSGKVYVQMLEDKVKPLNDTLFRGKHWIFQQDSAPAHKSKLAQNWLQKNVPEFIAHMDWPSGSPDLNPLDYQLWTELEEAACSKPHTNLEALKSSIRKAAANLPLERVRAAIDQWPDRLRKCVRAKDGILNNFA